MDAMVTIFYVLILALLGYLFYVLLKGECL